MIPFYPHPDPSVQHNDPHLPQVTLFRLEERGALTAFIEGFPEALDLALTNPPLAVALANAQGWDTFGLMRVDRAFIGGLLRQRRRRICGALGYPASERVVRILGKVQPQACAVNLLARVRCALRNPAVLSILSHLPTIGPAELGAAADLGNCAQISSTLFVDMVAQSARETDGAWGALVRQIETLSQLRHRACRMFRSVEQVRRCYFRLWRELIALESFDPKRQETVGADIPFPAVPIPGVEDIQPIASAAALVDEARAMKHCVLSYAERVAAGDRYLYRVMHPERATVLIGYRGTTWHLDELSGFDNQPVSSATEELVELWLRRAQAPNPQ